MAVQPRRLGLTRSQIARIVGDDPEAIRQFEALFNTVDTSEGISAEVIALAELAGFAPAQPPVQSPKFDTVDLKRYANYLPALEGRIGWNDAIGTANIGLQYNVVQQVGFHSYARVQNSTGVTIPRGTVVGFAGVGVDNVPLVTPYLANGSTPTLFVLGVMAHDLPDTGEQGSCAVWGTVTGLNTSAFSAGDILYASPSVAGALTATKPTAPNNVIPIAAVLTVSTTEGVLLSRPTIEQQKHYGEFTKTTDATPAAIDTAYALTFDNTEIALGISRGSPTSRIVASQSGLYQFTATVQIASGSSSAKTVGIWFAKNGTAVANSRRLVTININNGFVPISVSEFFTLAANDYIEVFYSSDDTNVTIDNVAATAFAPAAPAVVLAVTQVQQ
jgi:hypothetical protein